MSRPLYSMLPESGRSRAPTRCRSVVFPVPDSPRIATISPREMERSRFWSTSTLPPGGPKVRATAAHLRTTPLVSLIAQRLRGVELGRAPRGVQGGQERYAEGHADHGRHVHRPNPERDVGDEVDVRRQGDETPVIEAPGQADPERRPRERPGGGDHEPLQDEEPADRQGARAHRGEDPDVPDLLHHKQDEDRHDVERRDHDDEPDGDAHRELLEPERGEERPVHPHQVVHVVLLAERRLHRGRGLPDAARVAYPRRTFSAVLPNNARSRSAERPEVPSTMRETPDSDALLRITSYG